MPVLDIPPFDQYEIVPRIGSDSFEFRHKGGKSILVTQRVSLDTLIRLALEDEEVLDASV